MGDVRRNAAYRGANSLFNIGYVRIPGQVFIKKYTKVFVIFNNVDSNGIIRESKKPSRKEGEVTGGSWGDTKDCRFRHIGAEFPLRHPAHNLINVIL